MHNATTKGRDRCAWRDASPVPPNPVPALHRPATLAILGVILLAATPAQASSSDSATVGPTAPEATDPGPTYALNGHCGVSVGNCTGYCQVNVAGSCSDWCTVNVASACQGACFVAVASVCADQDACLARVVGICATAPLAFLGNAVAVARSNIVDATVPCDLGVGLCLYDTSGYRHCVVSTGSGPYRNFICWD